MIKKPMKTFYNFEGCKKIKIDLNLRPQNFPKKIFKIMEYMN